MTIDPRKIREIARVCAALSKSAPTPEQHNIFADLASKWLSVARDRETRDAMISTGLMTTVVQLASALSRKAH
jgi:hypothetical protein